ncbi:MAG: capsular biosynthesis protein [Thermodesulfobacteriota bacterium]
MILITSGTYVGQEIASELGLLPPAFLPAGNRRLFELQAELLREAGEDLCLSLPEDFDLCEHDRRLLERAEVTVIRVPAGLSLGESVRHVLCCMLPLSGPLRILHGDTLIWDIPFALRDVVSVGRTDAFYSWAEAQPSEDGGVRIVEGMPGGEFRREVLSGYFCFSDPYAFVEALTRSRGRFIDALNLYAANRRLLPVNTGSWLDFGHLQTYYRSKAALTTEREFNSLEVSRRTVCKSGRKPEKIRAEGRWYARAPEGLRLYLPSLLGMEDSGAACAYRLEYLYFSTLSELYVFGRLPLFMWETIFHSCGEFLALCRETLSPEERIRPEDLPDLYLGKTLARLEDFARQREVDLGREWRYAGRPTPSLERLARLASEAVPRLTEQDLAILHGDFCFSNILYDFRHATIKTIDPRGLATGGAARMAGDRRYDVAKLYHSVKGKYDFIKADRYVLGRDGERGLTLEFPAEEYTRRIDDLFTGMRLGGDMCDQRTILAVVVHLFLSMLPLHADRPDHQDAMLANALRLFLELENGAGVRGPVRCLRGGGRLAAATVGETPALAQGASWEAAPTTASHRGE